MSAGKAYLIPSGYSFEYGSSGRMEHIYFHLSLTSRDGIDMLGECAAPSFVPVEEERRKRCLALVNSNDTASRLALESEIYFALSELIMESGVNPMPRRYSREVGGAIDYINQYLSMGLRLSEIAGSVHISESSLTKKFRREVGKSVGEYIIAAVMKEAEWHLTHSDESIGEIAEKLGFCDQLYFSRRFKEFFGASPREYRRRTPL